MKHEDLITKSLGKGTVKSPLRLSSNKGDGVYDYINDTDRVLYDASLENFLSCKENGILPISFEKAGPREHLFFEPAKTKVAIVTCGGLCPGLNNVIRSLYNQLYYRYGVNRIIGIQYGYEGFISTYNHPVIELTPQIVENIHLSGGTILGCAEK